MWGGITVNKSFNKFLVVFWAKEGFLFLSKLQGLDGHLVA